MKLSVWYHITEKHPLKSGMYLAYKSFSMGDDYTEIDQFYYDLYSDHWFVHRDGSWANVQYWCDIDPAIFNKPPKQISPAEQLAFDAVIKAHQHYELISGIING